MELLSLFVYCTVSNIPGQNLTLRSYLDTTHAIKTGAYLLTLHLCSVIVNNQLDAQFCFRIYIYSNSLHVSSAPVLIIRRNNCINPLNAKLNLLPFANIFRRFNVYG
jgi:hypothetical protein